MSGHTPGPKPRDLSYERGRAECAPEIAALRLNLDKQVALSAKLLVQRNELLVALEDLISGEGDHADNMAVARAAIAKTRGDKATNMEED